MIETARRVLFAALAGAMLLALWGGETAWAAVPAATPPVADPLALDDPLALPADPLVLDAPPAAEAEAATVSDEMFTTNNLWILIAAALVFIMHLGFATLESGLCRAKNTVNILTKNVLILPIGVLMYWLLGFNLMYPGESWYLGGTWFGFAGFFIATDAEGVTQAYADGAYTYWGDFIFQAMFAATAATIVSGAVAERIKLAPFLVFTILFVGLLYPFTGSWKWGGGWLDELGFYDFAGSTIVHSVGGWGALMGVLFLGPRLGKYGADGRVNAIPGHSLPLATIGVFLLFLGWFGFNGGSVLSADPALVSLVFVTTTLAACAGAVLAAITSTIVIGKPDLSMILNGVLAGLVGITAGADVISPGWSIVVGGIAGILVVLSVIMFDKIRIDDPVGAISVHLVCGIWGTLAVALFGTAVNDAGERVGTLVPQLIGIVAMGGTAALFAAVVFAILKVVGGIRVSEAEEIEGLDIGEHGMHAYDLRGTPGSSGSGYVGSATSASTTTPATAGYRPAGVATTGGTY